MSKGNGKTTADVLIRADLATNRVNIQAPEDPLLTLQILLSAQNLVIQRLHEARAEHAKNAVQTAPASALRVLPNP